MLKQFLYLILNIIQISLLLAKCEDIYYLAMKKSNSALHYILINLINFLFLLIDKIIIVSYFK